MTDDEDDNLTDEELTAELLHYGVTPEMTKERVASIKAKLGLPDYCRNVRCGVAGKCSCPPAPPVG